MHYLDYNKQLHVLGKDEQKLFSFTGIFLLNNSRCNNPGLKKVLCNAFIYLLSFIITEDKIALFCFYCRQQIILGLLCEFVGATILQ